MTPTKIHTLRSAFRVPRATEHKATGQAVVRLNGRDFYLGKWGSTIAKARYEKLIAEWLARGRELPRDAKTLSINELFLAYWRHAEKYYRAPDGTPTSEQDAIRLAMKPLCELYGRTLVDEFGPTALKAVRERMIESKWCRTSINIHVWRIRHMFKWGTENELIPPSIYHALQAVSGLRRGRSEAKETEPVTPVAQPHIDAVLACVGPHVAAMIKLQLLTGCRPGEVCDMRTCDIDRSGRVWLYHPRQHKTAYRGHSREIYIGPKAQEVLKPFLKLDPEAYLFSPAVAESDRSAERRANRKTPMTPSQLERKPKKNRRRAPRDRYDVAAYRRAIRRACTTANVPPWHPHQLRHSAATWIRKEYGVEMARIILGHSHAFTTEIYAEVDRSQAMEVIGKIG